MEDLSVGTRIGMTVLLTRAMTGVIRYIAISTKVPPFDNIHCRMAVQYAVDKVGLQTVRGGPDAGGAIGTSMLPPNIDGYDPKLAPYTGTSGQPDLAKAKDELTKCGKPNGFTTVIAARNKGKEPKVAEALQQQLAKVGIQATIDASDPSLYYRSTIGSPDNVHKKGYGLMNAGWAADFPTGNGFLDVLVDGDQIQPSGNNNYEELNDPAIQDLIKQAQASIDPAKAADLWGQINAKVMDTAALLPYVYGKALNYRNPRLTNVYVDPYFGMYDFQALGVS
jgi:peptide/nickel transport system substrate-binding protein